MVSLSRLQVITPAADLALLTVAELRAAAGLAESDSSHDAQLALLGAEAGEWIAGDVLGIRTAGGRIPTVVSETVRETFSPAIYCSDLVLARRFISSVVSVTEGGMLLVEGDDYIVHDDRGVLERQSAGYRIGWMTTPIVVEYTAGFDNGSPSSVPPSIKAVASNYVNLQYLSGGSLSGAPAVIQSETVNDIDSVTYRDPSSSSSSGSAGGSITDIARSRLARFVAAKMFG